MATKKRRRSKNNASTGVLGGIIVLCLLAVGIVACANGLNEPKPEKGEGDSLKASSQTVSQSTNSLPVATDTTGPKDPIPEKTDSAGVSSSTSTTPVSTSSKKPVSSKTPSGNSDTSDYVSANDTASFKKDEWYMILANPSNALPENYTFPQATVASAGRNWTVDARCAEDLKAMLAAAKADGVDLMICSAYRTIAKQTSNFEAKVQEYRNKGYSEEEARKVTATIIAVPGTSEHHTGLAMDIVTPSYQRLNAGFDQTAAYKWLEAHCADFGFALRYRKDKTHITGIIYEPWHYRYVGKEAAAIMMNEKISFEEFLEKYGT